MTQSDSPTCAGASRAAFISAFCSVSADPPSALVCLRADSRIALAVAANGAFCVNVLPQSHQEISDRFAGCHDDRVADRFDGVDCVGADGAGPAIAEATTFSCLLKETVEFGSHRTFVGQLLRVREGAPAPLAYLNGAYHRVVPQAPVETVS